MKLLLEDLKVWFLEEKRDFPWRCFPTAYRVWISEVMLQQTQAAVVISYFEKWMRLFPSVEALSKAPLEEVIKCWEGLGYYSRARFLHQGAKTITQEYGGTIPSSYEALQKIKGIGAYTAGAILSFAFHQKKAAVDGNVLRVISRLFAIQDPIDDLKTQKKIAALVESLLPDEEPWTIMEALIELGACICTKNPKCSLCPLQGECQALEQGQEMLLPLRRKKSAVTLLRRFVPVIGHKGEYLIQKHEGKKVMAGLYEFPFLDTEEEMKHFFRGEYKCLHKLPPVTHSFTRFRAHLTPSVFESREKFEKEGFEWVSLSLLSSLPFSSGHRQILKALLTLHSPS